MPATSKKGGLFSIAPPSTGHFHSGYIFGIGSVFHLFFARSTSLNAAPSSSEGTAGRSAMHVMGGVVDGAEALRERQWSSGGIGIGGGSGIGRAAAMGGHAPFTEGSG